MTELLLKSETLALTPTRLLRTLPTSTCYEAIAENGIRRYELRTLHSSWLELIDLADFQRRIRLAALVRHPLIQRVIEFRKCDESYQVVLEACEATTLADEVQRHKIGIDELFQISRRLVDAVRECHRLGYTVCGLTPQTILRHAERQWIVDISGLVAPLFWNQWQPGDAERQFLPPEFLRRERLDGFSDSFSLAAVLQWLAQSGLGTSDLNPWGDRLLDALSSDAADRPTIDELATRMDDLQRSDVRRSPSSINPATQVDATIMVSADAAIVQSREPYLNRGLEPSSQLGRFVIEGRIGVGGMGEVYSARDELDSSIVAIKVLPPNLVRNAISIRRLAKEARVLAQVNNPNVANLLEFNSECPTPFMAVEFVAGGTLGAILGPMLDARKPLPERVALALIIEVVRGLAMAHERGIVHRDIKPDNVLLTIAGRDWLRRFASMEDGSSSAEIKAVDVPDSGEILAKLADFGLARFESQSESLAMTQEGTLLGTPRYMSPEQCRGETVDVRSDLYSLGVMLFEMLAGRPLFEAENQAGLIHKHCHELPPPLGRLRPDLSQAAASVVDKCLSKNRDARYGTAAELLIDVESLLRGRPTSIGLHPPIISLQQPDVLRFEQGWDLTSSPSALWPYVSNTDRLNHALGLSAVRYVISRDGNSAKRIAETTVSGQKIRWIEHPYEWVEGQRLSVLREFSLGPFDWFVNIVELHPRADGGCRLNQTFLVRPKNWLGRVVARWQLGVKVAQGFGKAYREIDNYLQQGDSTRPERDAFGKRSELGSSRRNRLAQRMQTLRGQGLDPQVVETLEQFLNHGSDLDVARIRPIALARRFRLDVQQTIRACLLGAQAGALTLLWDILCPSCRIPANIQETLSAIKSHGYCEACDVRFELDFGNSVELIFRPHPEVRSVETRTYCIGGPAWSPHVLAQVRLAAGERFTCELHLEEGAYVIRGPQLPYVIEFRTSPTETLSTWNVPLSNPFGRSRTLKLKDRSQVIHFHNDTGNDQQLRIERTASREDALTAAQASSLALFREIFPDEILSTGQMVSVAHTTVLFARIGNPDAYYLDGGDGRAFQSIRSVLDRISEIVRSRNGALVRSVGETVQATFSDPLDAVETALQILADESLTTKESGISLVIHSGPALVTTVDDRLDYFGATIHHARKLLQIAADRELLVTDSVTSLADTAKCLQASPRTRTVLDPARHNLPLIVQRFA